MPTSGQESPLRTLPTDRLPARRQLLVIRAACLMTQTYSKHDLATATGVPAERAALVMRFVCATGLATPAPGRGMYRASDFALSLAPQWQRSEDIGNAALGRLWAGSWFGKAARAKLTAGPEPRLRSSLAAHLLTRAHQDQRSLGCAEILVDLLVATGLLAPVEPGYLTWADPDTERGYGPGADIPGQHARERQDDQHDNTEERSPADEYSPADSGRNASDSYGRHRTGAGDEQTRVADHPAESDLLTLMNRTWQFADLIRLTEKEVISLHRSLHGLVRAANLLSGLDPADTRAD